MSYPHVCALVLAAGKGTRMRSFLPKALVPLAGRGLTRRMLDALQGAGVSDTIVVVGHRADEVRASLGDACRYALQEQQLGMAHAVAAAREAVGEAAHVMVVVGDSPLLRSESVVALLEHHLSTGAACTFLTATFPEPVPPYARVIRDEAGRLLRCVEERDASEEERAVRELLTSHYVFEARALWSHLDGVPTHPVTGERYLTDIVPLLLEAGERVEVVDIEDHGELVGLNTPEDVAWAEARLHG